MANATNATGFIDIVNGNVGLGQSKEGIVVKAFVLNIAVGLILFALELTGFLLLKSSSIGRRIYQPKTYLVQRRLRVEPIPVNPLSWLRRIFAISNDELKAKCGLDGYFFIRLIRALLLVFIPILIITVPILLPINFNGGKASNVFVIQGKNQTFNIKGLDTLAWQNVAPTQTRRYWAHLVCAVLAIVWTLHRIYREKVNFIDVRQKFLTSPEHRIKASARTVLVTNIPSEYRSAEALEGLYDVFVDNDDREKLTVWVNRDYSSLRKLAAARRSLRHALEKAELRILRSVNKKYQQQSKASDRRPTESPRISKTPPQNKEESEKHTDRRPEITAAFDADCLDNTQPWKTYLDSSDTQVSLLKAKDGAWQSVPSWKFWMKTERSAPKIAWLREEIARLSVEIEDLLQKLDDDKIFPRQNSAFIQFDRQMAAHMACSLASHHLYGRMAPRFVEVAPHEIIWGNMGVTSLGRLIKGVIALVLFVGILIFWGIPTFFLGVLSQLEVLRNNTSWLKWLQPWPNWVVGLISGPLVSILLALLIQLVVPALCRKLAVLVGSPTRSTREVTAQNFYFTFLFIELVLVTSISSGLVTIIPIIISNPVSIPSILANNLPSAANYFFNYLIIQALGFSGSVLFQYLRILYITMIWPWFTQTPREEAWLQTTIPHQMWANAYSLITNFAVIGLIYSIISPLMLIFVSVTFTLFWFVYRHNYYYVQRNKVDTHGLLFNNAISHLFTGVYVSEIALIGLFFLVQDENLNFVCKTQAILMIILGVCTAVFHFLLERKLQPLYELLPVSLEDTAVDAERERFLPGSSGGSGDEIVKNEIVRPSDDRTLAQSPETLKGEEPPAKSHGIARVHTKTEAGTAIDARRTLWRLKKQTAERVKNIQEHLPETLNKDRRREVADQLGAALEGYPDELTDLSPEERDAELKAAFQDPVTREAPPVIWLPQDQAGISDDTVTRVQEKYGENLQYSNAGAYLTSKNKCEVTQPAPDVRPDWLLDWAL